MSEEMVECSNCKVMFADSKISLHEAYCIRNIRKCDHCDEFVDKSEMEEHFEEKHTKKPCVHCKQLFEQDALQNHQNNECDLKPKFCEYCEVNVPYSNYEAHIYQCGARTKECFLCQKNILMKNYNNHMDTCVGIVEEKKVEAPQQVEKINKQQKQFAPEKKSTGLEKDNKNLYSNKIKEVDSRGNHQPKSYLPSNDLGNYKYMHQNNDFIKNLQEQDELDQLRLEKQLKQKINAGYQQDDDYYNRKLQQNKQQLHDLKYNLHNEQQDHKHKTPLDQHSSNRNHSRGKPTNEPKFTMNQQKPNYYQEKPINYERQGSKNSRNPIDKVPSHQQYPTKQIIPQGIPNDNKMAKQINQHKYSNEIPTRDVKSDKFSKNLPPSTNNHPPSHQHPSKNKNESPLDQNNDKYSKYNQKQYSNQIQQKPEKNKIDINPQPISQNNPLYKDYKNPFDKRNEKEREMQDALQTRKPLQNHPQNVLHYQEQKRDTNIVNNKYQQPKQKCYNPYVNDRQQERSSQIQNQPVEIPSQKLQQLRNPQPSTNIINHEDDDIQQAIMASLNEVGMSQEDRQLQEILLRSQQEK